MAMAMVETSRETLVLRTSLLCANTHTSCVHANENKHFFMHENSRKIIESHKMLGFYGSVVFKSCFIRWNVSSLKVI